jgi:nucleoid-associated protein YgaU
MRPLLIPCCCLLLFIVGCADKGARPTNGLVMTHDERWVTETAEIAQSEFAYQLGQKAAAAAGPGWQAKAEIRELPVLHAVNADEFGWAKMTVVVTLAAPAGGKIDGEAQSRAEAEIRSRARYKTARASDITVQTTTIASAAELPGAQKYTTVAGDTFAAISTAFYGTSQHWRVIADANPGIDGAGLTPGTVLIIPAKP